VPEQFEGNERVVYLTGHAHFNVARDIERPFIIYTEDSKTEVLGTSFDINTKSAGETEIIVTSGKVAFLQKGKERNRVTLTVNDQAVLDADKRITTQEVDALTLTAWKDNRLVFEGKTLKEVIEVLEPWYDVNIAVEDPSYLEVAFSLSGDNPTLEAFLKELCFAGRFSYRIEGKQVTLY
ncbi:MAG: FecR domain-containing protein, partial [Bacteroidota bacterium]